jgi:hypothetical protein
LTGRIVGSRKLTERIEAQRPPGRVAERIQRPRTRRTGNANEDDE